MGKGLTNTQGLRPGVEGLRQLESSVLLCQIAGELRVFSFFRIMKTELHARRKQVDEELLNKCRLELLGVLAWPRTWLKLAAESMYQGSTGPFVCTFSNT